MIILPYDMNTVDFFKIRKEKRERGEKERGKY